MQPTVEVKPARNSTDDVQVPNRSCSAGTVKALLHNKLTVKQGAGLARVCIFASDPYVSPSSSDEMAVSTSTARCPKTSQSARTYSY